MRTFDILQNYGIGGMAVGMLSGVRDAQNLKVLEAGGGTGVVGGEEGERVDARVCKNNGISLAGEAVTGGVGGEFLL